MTSISPTKAKFFLADDVRQETNRKLTLVGLYPHDLIIIVSNGRNKPSSKTPAVLHFVIGCILADGAGEFKPKALFTDPSGKKVFEGEVARLRIFPGFGSTLIMQVPQLVVSELGTYKVLLTVGTNSFAYEFQVVASAKMHLPDFDKLPKFRARPKRKGQK